MADSSGLTDQHKAQQLRKKLLETLKKEYGHLDEVVQRYFEKSQKTTQEKIQTAQAVIESLDHILEAGDWESSLFLKAQAKRLKIAKSEMETELQYLQKKPEAEKLVIPSVGEGEREVYISLFQSDGYNMAKWAVQLRSLSRYVVGRPVYGAEADIQKRIRLRSALVNEAYVVVAVKKTDVKADPFGDTQQDQFGHELLQLADHSVRQGKIIAFVHQGVRYYFIEGRLLKSS